MKNLLAAIILLFSIGCVPLIENPEVNQNYPKDIYAPISDEKPLRPYVSTISFDTSHIWDFGWVILEPIKIATDDESEKLLLKRLSSGQKALYSFWYLNEQVSNGGFIQFYWNNYRKYLPLIRDGLILIKDDEMLNLISTADDQYLLNKTKFDLQFEKKDWEPLYKDLKKFETLDNQYFKLCGKTMKLMEKNIRANAGDFICIN